MQRSARHLDILPLIWHNDDIIDQHFEHNFVWNNGEESLESRVRLHYGPSKIEVFHQQFEVLELLTNTLNEVDFLSLSQEINNGIFK